MSDFFSTLNQFRNTDLVKKTLSEIHRITTRQWARKEICGGQNHGILRVGIDELLSEKIELVHETGCRICGIPLDLIDKALEIAYLPNAIFTTFGDIMRVPGSEGDL